MTTQMATYTRDVGAPADAYAEREVEMRRRLVSYFDRQRRPAPEALADETLRRIERLRDHGHAAEPGPGAASCYQMARLVLLEDVAGGAALDREDVAAGACDLRDNRLMGWLRALPAEERELLIAYYRDSSRDGIERRRQLAARLGVTPSALGLRALRIRETLIERIGRRS